MDTTVDAYLYAGVRMVHDFLASPAWTGIQALGALVAAALVLWQLHKTQQQTEAIRATTGYDLLARFTDRFEEIRGPRATASRALQDVFRAGPPWSWTLEREAPVERVLDQFELLGLYLNRKLFDPEAAWTMFSHYVVNYYLACERSGFFEDEDPSHYEEFRSLYQQMQREHVRRFHKEEEFDEQFLNAEASR